MEHQIGNDELYKFLKDDRGIRDSSVEKITISSEDGRLNIYITFLLAKWRSATDKTLTVKFKGVSEYGFYWNNKVTFYTVSHYIIEKVDDRIYISLDPYNELCGRNKDDQDIIWCEDIEAFIIK